MSCVRVNVFCENYGWLFEDLKRLFVAASRPGLAVTASEEPRSDADWWVALRTAEAFRSPDLGRATVCLHDLFDDPDLYKPWGPRGGVHEAAALVLCHPRLFDILARAGVDLTGRRILMRPHGASSVFTPREALAPHFTVGWIGRHERLKRVEMFVAAIALLAARQFPVDVRFIGLDLGEIAAEVRCLGIPATFYDREQVPIEACPTLYQGLDCLVVTSSTEGGPLTLFDVLACGVPAISTPVGWAPFLAAESSRYVRLAEGPEEIAEALAAVSQERHGLFAERHDIAGLAAPWSLDRWVEGVLDLTETSRVGVAI